MKAVHQHQYNHDKRHAAKPHKRRCSAVEQRNYQNSDDVVGHRKRAQKHAHAIRNAISQKRQNSQRERDVGCGRNAPSMCGISKMDVENRVDNNGHTHAAKCSNNGQQRLIDVHQVAGGHFVLNFKAYQQEKHCHKNVVDNFG